MNTYMRLCLMHSFIQQHQAFLQGVEGFGYDAASDELYVLIDDARAELVPHYPQEFEGERISYRVRDASAPHGVREV